MSQELWQRNGDGTFAVAMPADFGRPLDKFYDLRKSLTEMWFGEHAHKVKLPRDTECQTDIHPFLIQGKGHDLDGPGWVSQDVAEVRIIMKDVARRITCCWMRTISVNDANRTTCPLAPDRPMAPDPSFSEQDTP